MRALDELKEFYEENGRVAGTLDKTGIAAAVRRKEWIDKQIETWEDLARIAYKGIDVHPFKYIGDESWEKVLCELKEFKQKHKKLPIMTEMKDIFNMIRQGEWKERDIKTWIDLLLNVFGEANTNPNKNRDYNSIEIVESDLKEFRLNNGRLPRANEMKAIRYAIRRGEWASLGIKKWNDLIRYIFGEVQTNRNKYIGEKGLKIAISELKEFKEQHKRLPKYDDKNMSGITSAIQRGEWKSFNIKRWNDLLSHIFGEINSTKFKYKGDKGLDLVVKLIKDFEKKNKKIPHYKDKGMSGIYKAVMRGEWTNKKIKNWKELLSFIFKI